MVDAPRAERGVMRIAGVVAVTLGLLVGHQAAPTGPPSGPEPRNKPGFVFDAARKVSVLFGGFGSRTRGGALADTWEWNGAAWTRVDGPSPDGRGALGMAYDTTRRKVVVFGGASAAGQFGDTWERDGTRWTRVATTGPSARGGMQLAYDERRRVVVGFGGFDQATSLMLGETWTWDGTAWTRAAASGPSPRANHVIAYDAARGRVVLFGGNGKTTPPPDDGLTGDTWEWDGTAWTKAAGAGPSRRDHHAMGYDAARGRLVLFGGWNGEFLGDTWEWDGATWSASAASGPSPRGGLPSMTYDAGRRRIVLFGGWDASGAVSDVWEWDGRTWTRRTAG